MPKRIVIHVGFWKCGSTTLQNSLKHYASAILPEGIIYPTVPTLRQRSLVDAFHTKPESLFWNKRRKVSDPKMLAQARDKGMAFMNKHLKMSANKTLALSCEHYIAMPEESHNVLKKHLNNHTDDICIVVYVRHPVSHARSAIQERVKKGNSTIEKEIKNPSSLPIKSGIEKLVRVFGHDNVIVRELKTENLHKGSISLDFLNIVKPRHDFSKRVSDIISNESLSMEGLLIANELAKLEPLVTSSGVRNANRGPRDYFHLIQGKSVEMPAEFEASVLALAANDIAFLKEHYNIDLQPPQRREAAMWSDQSLRSLAKLLNDNSLQILNKNQ